MSVFLHRHQIWSPDQGKRVIPDEIEDFHKDCLKRTVKFPKGIMVWGCMTAKGLGAAKYQEILHTSLPQSITKLYTNQDFVL